MKDIFTSEVCSIQFLYLGYADETVRIIFLQIAFCFTGLGYISCCVIHHLALQDVLACMHRNSEKCFEAALVLSTWEHVSFKEEKSRVSRVSYLHFYVLHDLIFFHDLFITTQTLRVLLGMLLLLNTLKLLGAFYISQESNLFMFLTMIKEAWKELTMLFVSPTLGCLNCVS